MVNIVVTATANYVPEYDLYNLDLDADRLVSTTSSAITAAFGDFSLTLTGSFQYDFNGALTQSSVVRGLSFQYSGSQIVTATGFSLRGYDLSRYDFATLITREMAGADTFTSAWNSGEYIETLGGNDTIRAGSGNDTIDGGTGYDTVMVRATGNEWLIAWGYSRGVEVSSPDGEDTLLNVERVQFEDQTALIAEGGAGNDRLISTQTVIGNSLWDMMNGRGGDDTIQGGGGRDFLIGERGNDLIKGGANHDYISGGDGNDILHGQAGNDKIRGFSGSDTIYGGAGNDTLYADFENSVDSDSADRLYGGAGKDLLVGQRSADYLNGGIDKDTLRGDAGQDTLLGGNGWDRLLGGADNDLLRGGNGRDYLAGHSGADVLDGGAHADRLFGGGGNDTLKGGTGTDLLNGGSGNDLLFGGGGNDTLLGGTGRDRLLGQAGDDQLTGGAYADTFVFHQGYGNDTITDFSVGQDRIQIGRGANGLDDLTFNTLGDDIQINFADVTILVENTTLAELDSADNFLF